jgi:pyruvate/2-oxoglutarate dehydrogenase complex dihydrolipoamide dehydrogenase (E3) component
MPRNLDDSRPAAAMQATGAKLFRGEGKLTDVRTVAVGSEQLVARRAVVIANGSTAAIPPILGLDTVDFWTNHQAAIPTELPVSLAILGGGAIGVELGHAFARLGCRVNIIEAGARARGIDVVVANADPAETARGYIHDFHRGALKGQYEPTAPKHHWSDWYAPYIIARQRGKTTGDAAKAATLSVEGTPKLAHT